MHPIEVFLIFDRHLNQCQIWKLYPMGHHLMALTLLDPGKRLLCLTDHVWGCTLYFQLFRLTHQYSE